MDPAKFEQGVNKAQDMERLVQSGAKSVSKMNNQEIADHFAAKQDVTEQMGVLREICDHAYSLDPGNNNRHANDLFMIAACLACITDAPEPNGKEGKLLRHVLFDLIGHNQPAFNFFHSAVSAAGLLKDFYGGSYDTLLQVYLNLKE